MEQPENTHQNPEPEIVSGQEENSSPVEITGNKTENDLPTESNQIELKTSEEFPENLPASVEDISEDHEKDLSEKTEETPSEEKDEVVSEITVEALQEPTEDALPEVTEEHLSEETEEHILEEADEHHAHETVDDFDALSREELTELLKEAVANPDVNSVKTRIALIKVAFLKKKKEEHLTKYEQALEQEVPHEEPQAEQEQDELDTRFNEIFNIYKANKARFNDEQEKLKKENLKKKFQILEQLKTLCDSEETLKKTYDEFRSLQEQWKQVGMVPRNEINNLWQNYHFQVERFFEKVKLNKELKDLDLKKNLEAKMALCEKTEELLLETSVIKSFKRLQKLHEEWKEIGPVPADKKDEIWERFKNATDRINELRREHYARIEDDQTKNLETKTALCEQTEDVLKQKIESIKDWQEYTGRVNEYLNIWKSVGSVPQKNNTAVWTRFKTSLDTFFANKKEFFDKLKDQQVHNYNLKLDLCAQAESLKGSTDWKKTTNELIRLQGEWKKIGPVPKKHSDKIWKRFRAACDEFFNTKSSYFTNIQSHEEENLAKKHELMTRLKEFPFGENKNENLEVLKNFQREWTVIGHVPIREKEKVQNEFRALINQQLDKLKISEVEMSTVTFQSRVEQMKNDPQSRKLIFREKEILAGKITKLRDDVNLWENNIGFLAKSKNAAILKAEFEEKINKAKTELKVMEAKFKLLRSQS